MQQDWKVINRYATVGLEFGLSMLVGLFGGRWLDKQLGTANWLTFIGFGFGIAAGYRAIYRAAKAANRDAEKEEAEERAQRQQYHDDPPRDPLQQPASQRPARPQPAATERDDDGKHRLN